MNIREAILAEIKRLQELRDPLHVDDHQRQWADKKIMILLDTYKRLQDPTPFPGSPESRLVEDDDDFQNGHSN